MFRKAWVAAIAAAAAVATTASSADAQALLGPLPSAPTSHAPLVRAACAGPVLSVACGIGSDALGAIGGAAGDVISAGTGVVGDVAMDGLSSWVGNGAAWLIERVARLVERSTRPDLAAPWFERQYSGMRSLALLLSLGFLMAALAHAALRQDLGAALRAAFVALPTAVLGCFVAVTLVQLALIATDSATAAITRQSGGDSREFFDDLAHVIVNPTEIPGFLTLIAALLAALLCLVVWIELILREAAIFLAVAFLPLTLAASVWHRTGHVSRRLGEALAALILSKLTIAGAVAFAAAALGHARGGSGGMTALLAGIAVLFLAALSPWALLRLVPLGGEHPGLHRGSVKQAARSAPGAASAAMVVRTGMKTSFAGAAAPVAGGALASGVAAAPAQPWRPPVPSTDGIRRPLPLMPSQPPVQPQQPDKAGDPREG